MVEKLHLVLAESLGVGDELVDGVYGRQRVLGVARIRAKEKFQPDCVLISLGKDQEPGSWSVSFKQHERVVIRKCPPLNKACAD